MEIEVDFTKSAQDNADEYYKKAKRLAAKRAGAERAVTELKQRLEKAARQSAIVEKRRGPTKVAEKEWYEKFHWFVTSNGLLVIAGRDAHQNEMLNSRYFDERDLFFHANIFGAAVAIMKNGAESGIEIRQEAAQFAASYSSAWKEGLHAVDVYAMRRNQVSKSTGKGSLGTGSFLLSGERDWYRGTRLELVMFMSGNKLHAVPMVTYQKIKDSVQKRVYVMQGKEKKSSAAKLISKMLGYDGIDAIMQQLPAGEFRIS